MLWLLAEAIVAPIVAYATLTKVDYSVEKVLEKRKKDPKNGFVGPRGIPSFSTRGRGAACWGGCSC